MHFLFVISRADRNTVSNHKEGAYMRRRKLKSSVSKKLYKKNTGIQKLNHINPITMRGGIRL